MECANYCGDYIGDTQPDSVSDTSVRINLPQMEKGSLINERLIAINEPAPFCWTPFMSFARLEAQG